MLLKFSSDMWEGWAMGQCVVYGTALKDFMITIMALNGNFPKLLHTIYLYAVK